jgi:hypothetical protein
MKFISINVALLLASTICLHAQESWVRLAGIQIPLTDGILVKSYEHTGFRTPLFRVEHEDLELDVYRVRMANRVNLKGTADNMEGLARSLPGEFRRQSMNGAEILLSQERDRVTYRIYALGDHRREMLYVEGTSNVPRTPWIGAMLESLQFDEGTDMATIRGLDFVPFGNRWVFDEIRSESVTMLSVDGVVVVTWENELVDGDWNRTELFLNNLHQPVMRMETRDGISWRLDSAEWTFRLTDSRGTGVDPDDLFEEWMWFYLRSAS